MDELRLNKVFAGFLCAGLLIMAGVQIAHVLVPDQQLLLEIRDLRYHFYWRKPGSL